MNFLSTSDREAVIARFCLIFGVCWWAAVLLFLVFWLWWSDKHPVKYYIEPKRCCEEDRGYIEPWYF
jgi:hypothetical protein